MTDPGDCSSIRRTDGVYDRIVRGKCETRRKPRQQDTVESAFCLLEDHDHTEVALVRRSCAFPLWRMTDRQTKPFVPTDPEFSRRTAESADEPSQILPQKRCAFQAGFSTGEGPTQRGMSAMKEKTPAAP